MASSSSARRETTLKAATDVPTVALSGHRSINVQKITHLRTQAGIHSASAHNNAVRNAALAQLWIHCASVESFTSSVAIGAIVDLVLKGSLNWSDALHGFENALTAADGQSLANIIHALSQLTIAAADMASSLTKEAASDTRIIYGVKNNRHPFVTLLTTKANVDTIILSQLDNIIHHQESSKYRIVAFDILAPFLDFCLLDQRKRTNLISAATLLWITKTLNACILEEELAGFVTHLLDYLCTIPSKYPLERSRLSTTLQATIQSVVDFFCLSTSQRSLNTEYRERLGGKLLLIMLAWTVDMRRYLLPTLSMMQSIQKLLRPCKGYTVPTLPFNTLWPVLSFLLMNPPTTDEQQLVVEWMHSVLVNCSEPLDAMIANLAFLPIFQVMGESLSELTSKRCSDILQRLEMVPRNLASLTRDAKEAPAAPFGVAAMIQAEISYLSLSWTAGVQDDEAAPYTPHQDATLSSLILTTLMFHPHEETRIKAITDQAQMKDGQLVTLVLFIYLLREDPSPTVKLHLLQEAIPMLVTSKDEVVTAKVLRTILTLINGVPNAPPGSKIASSHMGAIGVRILFLIWKRQPRVWKTLRHVIHEWVENRPRLLKTPQKGEPEYDMEVAILTTIRDICAHDAAGYAEVLIPFLASLLRSVELYASSICIIVETMNLTVEANVVEPRAAWNVLLCHVAEYAAKSGHSGMITTMCRFYAIVASRNEDTPVYLDLREAVLENYVRPLLTSQDPEILAAAWKTLSAFHAQEIVTVLPVESPTLLIRQLILEAQDTMVVDEYSLVLEKLVQHELLHMRRSLFKDATSKKPTSEAAQGTSELERMQGVLSVVSTNILQKWQSGDVNPGLRIGYALSSLLCSTAVERLPSQAFGSNQAPQDHQGEDESSSAIRARQGYRNVMTALTDVSLTDHVVERITAMEGWTALFDNLWVANDDAQTLQIAELVVSDLFKKISEGYVPAHCANAVLAITGLILSLHRHSHPASTVQSSLLAKHLLQNYAHQETASDIGASDEVQFAVLVSLSFITPLAAVDEKLVRSVLTVFTDRLEKDSKSAVASSEISSWSTFASGWAFCNLLAGLMDSPTKTAELNEICQQTLQQLMDVLESDQASFSLALGALMAVPRLTSAVASSSSQITNKDGVLSLEASAVQKLKTSARGDLNAFLENQQTVFTPQRLARLLGAPWVIAFSDRTISTPAERKEDTDLLNSSLLAATSRRDLQPQLAHFTVPFCHIIHTNLDVRNPSSGDIALFTGRIHSFVNLTRITPTSAARHTSVIALGSLFGIDWCHGPTVASTGSHGLFSFLTSSQTLESVTNSTFNTLIELAGLSIAITGSAATSESSDPNVTKHAVVVPGPKTPSAKSMLMVQDLKAGRLAAFVLGHLACHVHRLGQVDKGKVIGTSSEPKDYSRLPVSTSWLRALWDGLWEPLQMGTIQRAQKSYKHSLELLLYTVHSLPTPLPAVNWFPLLSQLVTLEPELVVPAIHMASRHAMTSTSLMEFLIMTLSGLKAESFSGLEEVGGTRAGSSAEELFVGEEGIGRILTLGGLPLLNTKSDRALAELDNVRGLDGLAKRLSLPASRVVDLIERLVQVLFMSRNTAANNNRGMVEVLQLIFLDTMSNHIRQYRQGTTAAAKTLAGKLSEEGKELLSELRSILLRTFHQLSIRTVGTATRVLRRLADLSLMSVSHLDAAPLVIALDGTDEDAGARVLKHAIGVASLYRAGYLNSQQESRLTSVAQLALQVMELYPSWADSGDRAFRNDYQLAESAISVLLYAMSEGVGERPALGLLSPSQQRKKNTVRLTWLQRILDLLVLVSGLGNVFVRGIRLLLGGAVLLLWDQQEILGLASAATIAADREGKKSAPIGHQALEAEAELLAMVDEDELFGEDGAYQSLEYNLVEDDVFEQWQSRFLQTVAGPPSWPWRELKDNVYDTEAQAQAVELEELYRTSVLGSVSLVLPDIMSGSAASSPQSEQQAASRVLRLCLDQNIPLQERQLLITVLRRAEELVPIDSSWVLLI